MRSLCALFILLVGTVWAQDGDSCSGCSGPQGLGMASARVDSHKMRLDSLSGAIDDLENRINNALNSDVGSAAGNLAARLNKLEGNGCAKRQFQCGGNARACISSLLVCDGSSDCENNADESDDVCRIVVPAGSAWEGDTDWTRCRSARGERMRIVITGNRRVKFFSSRLWVRALISFTSTVGGQSNTISYNTKGIYSFGERVLGLAPPQDAQNNLGIACNFNSDTQADCSFRQLNSGVVCGTVRINRA